MNNDELVNVFNKRLVQDWELILNTLYNDRKDLKNQITELENNIEEIETVDKIYKGIALTNNINICAVDKKCCDDRVAQINESVDSTKYILYTISNYSTNRIEKWQGADWDLDIANIAAKNWVVEGKIPNFNGVE